ncbi:hypothetical protein, partial [Pseudonocardia pini]|uniref:hypothetical protein n=1 Tax=Pseudonocardia pini TaxID=2758030 RepID=UPI0015F0AB5E
RLLRAVRTLLPPEQRADWWRDMSSVFAECTPAERRTQRRSCLAGSLRTVWTAWATRGRP